MSKHDFKKGHKQSFAGIDRNVMDHPDYINLSGSAVKVLNELARQHRGKNNGDLSLPHSVVRHRKLGCKKTLKKCIDELLKANLIVITRHGQFKNPGGVCTLYALTWKPIEDCGGKLEVKATRAPLRNFSAENNKLPSLESRHGSSYKVGTDKPRNESGQFSSSYKIGRLRVIT